MTDIETPPVNPTKPVRRLADGTYKNKPSDPNYFRNYYQEKLKAKKITCLFCRREVMLCKMDRHLSSKYCRELQTLAFDNLLVKKMT